MLHVVGGTYREVCEESSWDQMFGSGLRAAAIASHRCSQVLLTTYVAEQQRPALDAYTRGYGIDATAETVDETLTFHYDHGLARPLIDPPLHLVSCAKKLSVEGEAVLRFGILEGDAIVNGDRVVFDPQSSYDPRPYHENGSTAKNLAIVANHSEAVALSGLSRSSEVAEIGRAVQEECMAQAVVIKCGARGFVVCENSTAQFLPALRTSRVFPIGSGDIFSAVFAINWATNQINAVASAKEAAIAAAFYCSQPREALTGHADRIPAFEPIRPSDRLGTRSVYLASPFFTTATRWMMRQAYRALRGQGVDVFSPYHQVGYGPAGEVAPADLAGLEESDSVFAVVDGCDAGTLFEVGYARSRGIPVVAFVQNEPPEPLKMLEGTGCLILDDFVSAVYQAVWLALEK